MIEMWLKQMCYRQITPTRWIKPYAYTLISVEIEDSMVVMGQWFVAANEDKLCLWKIQRWNLHEFENAGHIQHMEAEVTRQGGYFGTGNYELLIPKLSIEEQVEYELYKR